jgi:hypothetical protein
MCVGADVIFVDAIRPSSGIQRSIVSLAAAQQQQERNKIKATARSWIYPVYTTAHSDDAALCNDKRHTT